MLPCNEKLLEAGQGKCKESMQERVDEGKEEEEEEEAGRRGTYSASLH